MPQLHGLARLLRLHAAGENLSTLCNDLIQQATRDPEDACALLDTAIILQFHGHQDLARQIQREALTLCRHYRLPASRPAALRLLALLAPGDLMANVPIDCLLEGSDIDLDLYYTTGDDAEPSALPAHDLLFVAIGESDANRPLLAAWEERLAAWPRPVLNPPARIARVARDRAAQLLQGLPGLLMPPTLRTTRAELELAAAGGLPADLFPLIVRPFDSHAGHDLNKVEDPRELSAALAATPGDGFFVSPFVDYRSADGLFRKYRLVLIAGRPYAVHMAISEHWMIHYLNAGMADSAAKRAEEAAFMAGFDQGFASRHAAALTAIHQTMGLDYLGIDCAETPDGQLLVFEVDPAMVVHATDPVDTYPYKQSCMQTLFTAFRAMLLSAAGRAPNHS